MSKLSEGRDTIPMCYLEILSIYQKAEISNWARMSCSSLQNEKAGTFLFQSKDRELWNWSPKWHNLSVLNYKYTNGYCCQHLTGTYL